MNPRSRKRRQLDELEPDGNDNQSRCAVEPFTLESAIGSVKPLAGDVDVDEAIRAAKEERVERLLEKLKR